MMNRCTTPILAGALMVIAGGFATHAAAPGAGFPPRGTLMKAHQGVFGGDASLTLPDGTAPASWEKPAGYSRTYVVDQHNPDASDSGEGTPEHPFRTISRAAEVVAAGERVLVRAGIYREAVQPRHGGDGPERMVTFEAAPGQAVIIRGSCILPRAWQRSAKSPASGPTVIWTLRLPEADFAAYNPFSLANLDERDGHAHPWEPAGASARAAAYTRKRGLLFQDGRRLEQVSRYEDLAAAEGSYWVEAGGRALCMHPLGGADPNAALMEATNRRQCFAPAQPGVSYLRLKGFIIEQVGDAFSYPVEAAVSPMGGHHWIIEDNVIRQVNADGINIGGYVWVWGGDRASNCGWDCIVRRNTISDCGVSAIKGLTPVSCVIADNIIERIAWQGVESGYDNGGMKLLVCRNTMVRHNLIRDVVGGPAVWLDWDNVNCRVTRNVVMDVQSAGGGIFIEASQQTNWVDHNVIWNIKGNGVYQHDTDELVVFNNLIGHCTDAAVRMQVCTTRKLNGRAVTCKQNQVRDNVLVDNTSLLFLSDPDNSSDHNVISDSRHPDALALWQKSSGKDLTSRQLPLKVTLDGATLCLGWAAPDAFMMTPGEVPGPFNEAALAGGSIRLFDPPSPR